MQDAIKLGQDVVIWPNTIIGKDINEMIMNGLSPDEIERIMGHHSREIEKLLGYVTKSEVIHKDDIVEI